MPLSHTMAARIRAEAKKRGADPEAAIAEAELHAPATEPAEVPAESNVSKKPVADRLLIGFLPFIKVRELRSEWLGLSERIPDDEMTCGDYQAKHGGVVINATSAAPEGG